MVMYSRLGAAVLQVPTLRKGSHLTYSSSETPSWNVNLALNLLPLYRDGLQLEVASRQKRPRPDEFPRWIVFR